MRSRCAGDVRLENLIVIDEFAARGGGLALFHHGVEPPVIFQTVGDQLMDQLFQSVILVVGVGA